ncbi:SLBB domain-containing protein [Siccirubricoccus sp. KC 17139]|uniref:SLBB domain-containing protein n=1 Tax=Siccirubricoccus soli TaxID=2899147 RepID=A0ABT1D137_9PROT|nr:SLBB domain-containing protein [Siccirubricoccus soli]MCO6414750.1 SLBB domain-containing protein [Siccirubricoccus soli]MCP2680880.1 SLBB domain-containing protein [Siccirubricoccus soli]
MAALLVPHLLLSPGAPAWAQTRMAQAGAPNSYLVPPSLPPSLPGGAPLPSLPMPSQQEILQRLLDAGGMRPSGPATPGFAPPPVAAQPLPPAAPLAAPEEPLSPAEAFFAARDPANSRPLRQFGYENLRGGAPQGQSFGMLPDDYLLGRDDEVVLAFRGRARQTLTLRIGRDGMLVLPDLPPIPAAGRTLRELRAELEARAQRDLGGSEVFVSLGQLRQIGIFVGGEVARPGLQALTSLSSVLDALVAAGGIRRTGSLRAIRMEGPKGRRSIDLYPVIAGEGTTPDLHLSEGERILVPPLGAVAAIGGEVSRPGIYELPAGAAAAPLATMLRLAGDPLRPSGNRFLLQTTDGEGRRSLREIGPRDLLRRGDALRVEPGSDVVAQDLRLAGHVAAPLLRAAGGRGQTLRGLLADPRLVRADPYPRLGAVWRMDSRTRTRRFEGFDLGRVLSGQADAPLREGDEVILLGMADVMWLASPSVQQALRGDTGGADPNAPLIPPLAAPGPGLAAAAGMSAGASAASPGTAPPGAGPAAAPAMARGPDCPALIQLTIAAQASPWRYAHIRSAGFPDFGRISCPQVFLDYPALLPFLLDQAVLLTGEVRLPGLYPIVDGAGLDAVIATAGGATDTADLSTVEFAREPAEQSTTLPLARTLLDLRSRNFAAVRLSPRDVLRLPRGFADRDLGPVTLVGEFLRPGTYDIRRGEKLSEVIARAGGLTPQAYPYGAVFSRDSVRQRQQEGFQRTARELEQGLMQVAAGQAVAGLRGQADLGGAITAGQALANTLRSTRAAGRMVVEANPVVLAARPDLDVLLEPGDLIAMPKRPNEVTVVGSVLNPGSLQFATGWRAADYVRAAGGEQRFADGSRAFVVLPNGQSTPAGLGAWQSGGPPIPPGSVVVVPQDPSPYESWGLIRDVTQVLSQIALSSAALAVIVRSSGR